MKELEPEGGQRGVNERFRAAMVDDDPTLYRIIKMLERYGFHDEEFCRGPEDLLAEIEELCHRAKYDYPRQQEVIDRLVSDVEFYKSGYNLLVGGGELRDLPTTEQMDAAYEKARGLTPGGEAHARQAAKDYGLFQVQSEGPRGPHGLPHIQSDQDGGDPGKEARPHDQNDDPSEQPQEP